MHDQHAVLRPRVPTPERILQVITQPESVELLVSDNGPGFPDALEPLQPLISLKEDGYGIGLFVVQLSVQNHGGSITIGRSQRLGGAEVRLLLPTMPITTTSPSLSA